MISKNIAFFSGDITKSGGTENVTLLIANELCKKSEYNIHIVSLEKRKEIPFFNIDERIKCDHLYTRINRSITHIFGIIRRLKKYVKDNNIDILVDVDCILDIYSLPVKFFTGVKIVSWEHFNYYQNPFVSYRKIARRMSAKWANMIVTLTKEDVGYYSENLKLKSPIKYIYNPIILKGKVANYKKTSKTIISVGRLTYQKGFDMLVDIAKEILPKYPDWRWLILGDGEDYDNLKKSIIENGLEKQLLLTGNVTNINDYYSKSAFYVMTSRFEGLPMTLLEARSYKIPIVSYKCKTGPSELIKNGVNGYLIEENDKDAMISAIEKMILDENLRENFSNHSMDDMDSFKLDTIIKQWEELFGEL